MCSTLVVILDSSAVAAVSHYGALQGLDKQETVQKYGKEQVNVWRRSYDIPPPPVDVTSSHYPGNDIKYQSIPAAAAIRTESLKVSYAVPVLTAVSTRLSLASFNIHPSSLYLRVLLLVSDYSGSRGAFLPVLHRPFDQVSRLP